MLKLNLIVFDENGERINGLSQENVAPQHIQAVLLFLRPNWRFEVECLQNDVNVNPVEQPKN